MRASLKLGLYEALLRDGVARVEDVDVPSEEALRSFVGAALGGLQKDPCREIPNWKIVVNPKASSISCAPPRAPLLGLLQASLPACQRHSGLAQPPPPTLPPSLNRNPPLLRYDAMKRLADHTDQSVPPWGGVPGIVLSMHYTEGRGCNTLTDGYAGAEELRRRNPEGYELLSRYGSGPRAPGSGLGTKRAYKQRGACATVVWVCMYIMLNGASL